MFTRTSRSIWRQRSALTTQTFVGSRCYQPRSGAAESAEQSDAPEDSSLLQLRIRSGAIGAPERDVDEPRADQFESIEESQDLGRAAHLMGGGGFLIESPDGYLSGGREPVLRA